MLRKTGDLNFGRGDASRDLFACSSLLRFPDKGLRVFSFALYAWQNPNVDDGQFHFAPSCQFPANQG